MQRESNWRYYLIITVTILSVLFIMPTLRYVYFTFSHEAPARENFKTEDAYKQALDKYDETRGDLQRNAITFGLDLVGGVDVLLKINVDKTQEDLLEIQRDNLVQELQNLMIDGSVRMNDAGDGLILQIKNLEDARQVNNLLADYVQNRSLASYDKEALSRDGKTVLKLSQQRLDRYVNDAIRSAEQTIRRRVDEFGVTQPSVSLQEDSHSIRIQVPGESDPERVIREIIRPAQLEFYVVHENSEQIVAERFEKVKEETARGETKEVYKLKEGESLPAGYQAMPGIITKSVKGTRDLEYTDTIYIVKNRPEMTGKNLADAWVRTSTTSLTGQVKVSLSFNPEGAAEFRDVTKKYQGERLAVALDGEIRSAPVIRTVIHDGQAVIEGDFTVQEANDLAMVLKAGALPADLIPQEKRAVGPTLGAESITQSFQALIIGAICIAVFMIIYYGAAGFISILALILNLLVILACLDMFDATLTLSGIGGMILTLGMAVDANVLIYERIREELDSGRDVRAAVRSGYSRAFSVIFDSNLTTLLAALVLLQFGQGTVQGFALTMAFGLLANLFTGLTVTYALCSLWYRIRGKLSLGALRIFRNPTFDFIGMRKFSFPLSATVFLALALYIGLHGIELAVDFRGGVMSEVRLANTEGDRTADIKEALSASGLSGDQAKVQKVVAAAQNDYLVRLALQENPDNPQQGGDVTYTQTRLEGVLKDKFGDKVEFLGTTAVSKEVGQGFQQIALMVILGASAAILIYLWFRFELVFGLAAVIALIHDLTITLGIITLLNVQISLDIVSALMILLGFSVNDTIVIFDRIRENSHLMFGRSFKDICNNAMNRSLSRTMITSLTTIGVMTIMYLWGGHSLQPFALTLIIGGIVGTYSSDFLASPFVYWWNERQTGRLLEHLGRKGAAAAGTGAAAAGEAPSAGPAAPAGASAGGGSASAPTPNGGSRSRRRGRR